MTKKQAGKLARAVTKSCGCCTHGRVGDPAACVYCIIDMLMDLKPPEPKPRGGK